MRHIVVIALVSVLGAATQVTAVASKIECLTVEATGSSRPPVVDDPDCTIATHPLTAAVLPDLAFSSTVGCFSVAGSEGLVVDGRPLDAVTVAYAGLTTNGLAADATLAGLPVPLFDDLGVLRFLVPFTAATVFELRSKGDKLLAQFVTRDTGWAEVDTKTAVPTFVSERQVITHGTGVLKGARGELFQTGDQFGGDFATKGTLCVRGAQRKLRKLFR